MKKTYLALAERLDGIAAPEHLADYRDLVNHGEGVIALQNICQNLYEYDTPLPQPVYEQIVVVAKEAGLADRDWAFLKELVRGN